MPVPCYNDDVMQRRNRIFLGIVSILFLGITVTILIPLAWKSHLLKISGIASTSLSSMVEISESKVDDSLTGYQIFQRFSISPKLRLNVPSKELPQPFLDDKGNRYGQWQHVDALRGFPVWVPPEFRSNRTICAINEKYTAAALCIDPSARMGFYSVTRT